MAEEMTVENNTPEQVAYDLMMAVAFADGKIINGYASDRLEQADRKYILQTYAECLVAVKEPMRYRKDGTYEAKSFGAPTTKIKY